MSGESEQKLSRLRDKGFPSFGTLELTTKCNLYCKYCYVSPAEKELTTDEVFDAINRMVDAGILSVLLTGGEIFLREDILDILGYVTQKNFFQMCLLSNGSALGHDHMNFLVKHKEYLLYIRFSFFSNNPATHDAFTGTQGSFAQTLCTADTLKRRGVTVAVIINITEDNVDNLDEVRSFFSERGFLVYTGISKIITENNRDSCRELTTKPFFKRYFAHYPPDATDALRHHFEVRNNTPRSTALLCDRVFGSVTILADGGIVPCVTLRNCPISNIRSDTRPLSEILQKSPLLQQLRSILRNDLEKCSSCQFISYCNMCPGVRNMENHSFVNHIEQECNYMQALYEQINS